MPTLKYTVLKILLESDHPQLPISFYHFPGQNLFATCTYVPTKALLCNKKCIQELADASSRTPLHPAAAMIEHQTHVQLTSLTNTYADKDHLYTFLNMLGLDLIGQEIIHKNLFKFKTHKKKITKTNAISNSKHIFCLMQPKQLQTKS